MTALEPVALALPYFVESEKLFTAILDQPWAVFLDSAYPNCRQGRFDILACDPVCTLVTRNQETEVTRGNRRSVSLEDPFLLLKQQLSQSPFATNTGALPFYGGAIGYFAYDLGRRLEKITAAIDNTDPIADMAVGIYAWAVVVDHQLQQSWLVGDASAAVDWETLRQRFSRLPAKPPDSEFEILAQPSANMDKVQYAQAFARIKGYLKEGDCYQINFAQQFSSPCRGDPWQAYRQLRRVNSAPFSAYLRFPDAQVLSSSPERFLQVREQAVETKPIKGTRPRKTSAIEDLEQIRQLRDSQKDRAENLMIVDLLRNDISKNCEKGTVKVPELFAVESFKTVHHLVSTITGKLSPDRHALDLLRNCFPGGSITGAPKIRAMQIIEELEPSRRGVYCGSIGYIGFDGNMDCNIAIRTLVHKNDTIRFGAGGGIVNDSQMEDEYRECFDKAAALIQLLQLFLLDDSH